MTNGEKLKELFPNTKIITQYDNPFGDRFIVFTLNNENMEVNMEWWDAEYKESKCQWIKYDYRTICPAKHDIKNPYWRIPETRMDALKYCPYCGKEIEVEK